MSTASRPQFLRRFSAAGRRPRAPELADMGTAFALDHILDEVHQQEMADAHRPASRMAAWRQWLGRKLGN